MSNATLQNLNAKKIEDISYVIIICTQKKQTKNTQTEQCMQDRRNINTNNTNTNTKTKMAQNKGANSKVAKEVLSGPTSGIPRNVQKRLLANRGVEDVNGENILRLCGGIGSPYSNKMLFYLRYRRIPYRWIMMNSKEESGTKHSRGPVLLPKILWPDGSVQNDSTFLVERLEREHRVRASYPTNHDGLTLLVLLLEDFADEWLSKCMYHYRWTKDPRYAGKGIAMMQAELVSAPSAIVDKYGSGMEKRQVDRLSVVGSNSLTGPAIESFYESFLQTLDKHLENGHPFIFGSRPSVADFAICGQLHPMIHLDRETSHITRGISERVCAWYSYNADLSGLSVIDESQGWIDTTKPIPDTLKSLLSLVGNWYIPFLIANDHNFKSGKDTFKCKVNNGKVNWEQPTFKYQSKCLAQLVNKYKALSPNGKKYIDAALEGTGVSDLFVHGNREEYTSML